VDYVIKEKTLFIRTFKLIIAFLIAIILVVSVVVKMISAVAHALELFAAL